jgi:hypothetical protein
MSTGHRLQIILWVPVAVKYNHDVCCSQVEPQTASLGQVEKKRISVNFESMYASETM